MGQPKSRGGQCNPRPLPVSVHASPGHALLCVTAGASRHSPWAAAFVLTSEPQFPEALPVMARVYDPTGFSGEGAEGGEVVRSAHQAHQATNELQVGGGFGLALRCPSRSGHHHTVPHRTLPFSKGLAGHQGSVPWACHAARHMKAPNAKALAMPPPQFIGWPYLLGAFFEGFVRLFSRNALSCTACPSPPLPLLRAATAIQPRWTS